MHLASLPGMSTAPRCSAAAFPGRESPTSTASSPRSWRDQVEVYFLIVQRKVLTTNDFPNLDRLQQRLLDFQPYYEQIARPFKWKFTRRDLENVLQRLPATEVRLAEAA